MTTPIEREALSDAQIDAIARKWFCAKLGEEDGDWGPNTLNAVWCQEIGRPFARAILAASSDEDRKLAERLKLEAQSHAQEARTANATIAEIYQLVTGATGEPGNWHGAEPVRQAFARIRAEALEEAAKVCDREESACRERTVYAGALIASHIGSAIRALVQPSTGQKT